MSNCKNLKMKLDRTLVCKLTGKKINWDLCKNCKLRELKINNIQVVRKSPSKKKDISSKTRKIVNERDNHTCRLCGKPSVHQHHIIFRSSDSTLIDEPDNIICLCLECHQLVHSNKKKYQPMLQKIIQDIKKESGN